MRAIGNNLIIKKIEESNQKTKGGLILTEKQREDVRFQQAKVVKVGDSVVAVKKTDCEELHLGSYKSDNPHMTT